MKINYKIIMNIVSRRDFEEREKIWNNIRKEKYS